MNIHNIKKLAEAGNVSDALAEINLALLAREEDHLEVLRIRAYIHNLSGNYAEALEDRLEILKSQEPKLKDYFLCANAALYTKSYCLAEELLNNLLEKSIAKNNTWFDSAAYFLLAYCNMKEGNYNKARINVDAAESIETDISIPIPQETKTYDVKTLRREIQTKIHSENTK